MEYSNQQIIAPVFQIGVITQGARSNNSHHLAINRPLAGCGVANLFADGDGLTRSNQPCNVSFRCMKRYARHGNGVAAGLPPCSESNIHQFCGFFGVVIEQRVKVPHAVKHQFIWVLTLDLEILLHHGCVRSFNIVCTH
ncbi:hypothetical protein LCGC14_1361180 [marine sediment metagenome]|uniref:Uncharacterized protein n=1 Tax=marine sediment metagenome TaxID=412755 RepID=A0A0F9K8Q6_9ZZZZ